MNTQNKSGQAMIEFMVGIVGVMVLVGGMLQIGILTREHSEAMMEATRSAHEEAMFPVDTNNFIPPYMRDWATGNDARKHSADDRRILDSGAGVMEAAAEIVQPRTLENYTPNAALTKLPSANNTLEAGEFIRGSSFRIGIPLLPVIRNYVYRDNSLNVNTEAYMVWTQDL